MNKYSPPVVNVVLTTVLAQPKELANAITVLVVIKLSFTLYFFPCGVHCVLQCFPNMSSNLTEPLASNK